MSWSTRRTPLWDRQGSSTRRFRCWTSQTRSRWVTRPLGSCDAAVQLAAFQPSNGRWEKKLGGKKLDDPHSLKSNEMAECSFQPQQPLVCDTFKNCEGLSRVAFLDGNGCVMLGKVVSCERKDDTA